MSLLIIIILLFPTKRKWLYKISFCHHWMDLGSFGLNLLTVNYFGEIKTSHFLEFVGFILSSHFHIPLSLSRCWILYIWRKEIKYYQESQKILVTFCQSEKFEALICKINIACFHLKWNIFAIRKTFKSNDVEIILRNTGNTFQTFSIILNWPSNFLVHEKLVWPAFTIQ